MHHIYTTKAIIIKSTPIGEANRLYFLLTEDLGFIKATAQGVRLSKSKLKGHLQDFCLVNISVVKGKSTWRITSVDTIIQEQFIKNIDKLSIIKNIFSLLLRLLHGEEKNSELFSTVESSYNYIFKENVSIEDLKNLEIITVLRILYYLGYFKTSLELALFVEGNTFSRELFDAIKTKKKQAILQINTALQETHL